MTSKAIFDNLVEAKVSADLANQYAQAMVEYQEASENIEANGSVVMHPRTANVIPNPYLKVRDAAHRRLLSMRPLVGEAVTDWIWKISIYNNAKAEKS